MLISALLFSLLKLFAFFATEIDHSEAKRNPTAV